MPLLKEQDIIISETSSCESLLWIFVRFGFRQTTLIPSEEKYIMVKVLPFYLNIFNFIESFYQQGKINMEEKYEIPNF